MSRLPDSPQSNHSPKNRPVPGDDDDDDDDVLFIPISDDEGQSATVPEVAANTNDHEDDDFIIVPRGSPPPPRSTTPTSPNTESTPFPRQPDVQQEVPTEVSSPSNREEGDSKVNERVFPPRPRRRRPYPTLSVLGESGHEDEDEEDRREGGYPRRRRIPVFEGSGSSEDMNQDESDGSSEDVGDESSADMEVEAREGDGRGGNG